MSDVHTVPSDLLQWLENHLHCRINTLPTITKSVYDTHSWLNTWQPDQHNVVHTVTQQQYSLEFQAQDLQHLIRVLEHAHIHEQAQQRYPQLRDAYMNYVTQVHLTIM